VIGNFLPAPMGFEKVDREMCRINHKLEEAGSGLEQKEGAIELIKDETDLGTAGLCRDCRENWNFGRKA